MKVFQYMAMGTVPMVSDVGDLRSYVQDGQAGVVVAPGDAAALASALTELLQDEERCVRMAKEAWRLAGDDHSWQSRAEALSAFLTETDAASYS
jgi:glycosyltransferase involved in cell wall biosynthesis